MGCYNESVPMRLMNAGLSDTHIRFATFVQDYSLCYCCCRLAVQQLVRKVAHFVCDGDANNLEVLQHGYILEEADKAGGQEGVWSQLDMPVCEACHSPVGEVL